METLPGGYIEHFLECFPEMADFVYDSMRMFQDQSPIRSYYERGMQFSQENPAKPLWNNVEPTVRESIFAKLPLKFQLKIPTLSKVWKDSEKIFYAAWMNNNQKKWTKCSFRNVMKSSMDCKAAYIMSSDEWREQKAPTLLRTQDIGNDIIHISFSNDSKLISVCCVERILIVDYAEFTNTFTRYWKDPLCSYFNSTDNLLMVHDESRITVMTIAGGLPVLCRVSCRFQVTPRSWLIENLFLSCKQESDMTFFWMYQAPEISNTNEHDIKHVEIFKIRGFAYSIKACKVSENRIFLLYKIKGNKLGIKGFSGEDIEAFEKKLEVHRSQEAKECQNPDREVDCIGIIDDFVFVADGINSRVYVLTSMSKDGICFLTIDLQNFQLKASNLLVPSDYSKGNLHANELYIMSESTSNLVYIWEIKSGMCMARIDHEGKYVIVCAAHLKDPRLIITADYWGPKMKLYRLE